MMVLGIGLLAAWTLAGCVMLGLLNVAKWAVRSAGGHVDPRPHHHLRPSDLAELASSVARHPAGRHLVTTGAMGSLS